MHSSIVSLPDDPIKLKAEVVQLRDVVEEKEQALTENRAMLLLILLRKREKKGQGKLKSLLRKSE